MQAHMRAMVPKLPWTPPFKLAIKPPEFSSRTSLAIGEALVRCEPMPASVAFAASDTQKAVVTGEGQLPLGVVALLAHRAKEGERAQPQSREGDSPERLG